MIEAIEFTVGVVAVPIHATYPPVAGRSMIGWSSHHQLNASQLYTRNRAASLATTAEKVLQPGLNVAPVSVLVKFKRSGTREVAAVKVGDRTAQGSCVHSAAAPKVIVYCPSISRCQGPEQNRDVVRSTPARVRRGVSGFFDAQRRQFRRCRE